MFPENLFSIKLRNLSKRWPKIERSMVLCNIQTLECGIRWGHRPRLFISKLLLCLPRLPGPWHLHNLTYSYPPTPGRWYLVQWWILHMPKRMAGQVARIHGVLYNALFFYRVIWKTLWHLEHPLFGNSKKKYRKEEKNNSLNIIQNILQHSSLSSISYFNISFHFSSSSIILSFHFIQLSLSYHFIRKGILKLFMIN